MQAAHLDTLTLLDTGEVSRKFSWDAKGIH